MAREMPHHKMSYSAIFWHIHELQRWHKDHTWRHRHLTFKFPYFFSLCYALLQDVCLKCRGGHEYEKPFMQLVIKPTFLFFPFWNIQSAYSGTVFWVITCMFCSFFLRKQDSLMQMPS